MKQLALELARITEASAIASAEWIGRRNAEAADAAAVDVMRQGFNNLDIDGTIVIGEGERDKAPMLFIGEKVGKGSDTIKVDIAVDPLEGTSSVAYGRPEAMCVMAVAQSGELLAAPDVYMKKIAVGPKCRGVIDINASVKENICAVADALGKLPKNITVMVLDRERHLPLIEAIVATGAKVHTFSDGDVSACMATCEPDSGIDLYLGIGGAPEGVLAAAALRCMGGEIQGQLCWINDDEKERLDAAGYTDLDRVYRTRDLASGDEIFFVATAVTDGAALNGVRYLGNNRISTDTIVMRTSSGTIRRISAVHDLNKKDLSTI
ncbi:MAG: class II fructose-bisphosphatase [Candidatus Cloacimonetes bacterium]|nr:class II fructose-bisphosphatase [Candidatus Cloacimonadota bacterium]